MSGTVDGCDVTVSAETRGAGKSARRYTVFRVRYPRPLGVDFRISEAGVLSGVARFLGAQDIETGDAEFDARYTIKGDNPAEVVRFLTPERRAVIAEFLPSCATTIGGDEVHWEERGTMTDAETIRAKVRDLVRCARGLAGVSAEEPERREQEPAPPEETAASEEMAAPLTAAEPGESEPSSGDAEAYPSEPEAPAGKPEPERSAEPGVEEVCRALFGSKASIFETRRTFEERYRGRDVVWEGRLRSVDEYSYDIALGLEPGVKGTFEVFKVSSGLSGEREVLAAVKFPPEDYERLEGRIGSVIRFRGRLCEVDCLVRTLYMTDGAIFG